MDSTTPTLNQTNTAIQQKQPQAGLAITQESLATTPQIKLPKTPLADTTSAAVIESTKPSIASAEQNYLQAQQAAGTTGKEAQIALQKLAENIFGEKAQIQTQQADLEKQAGLQQQQKALGEINTEIAEQQVGLRAEQDKIRQQFASEAQKQISQNTLNDTYGRRLADLAIRQAAANANITAIQTAADRQTKLLTTPLDTKISYLSTFGKDNVDYLNTEQKNKLDFLVKDIEGQKKDIEALQSAKTAMLMEIANNGGGSNQALIKKINEAKDISTVSTLGASSGYVGKLDRTLKQAQIGKIYQDIANDRIKNLPNAAGLKQLSFEDNAKLNATPQAKAINDGVRYAAALDNYKSAIQKYGTGELFGQGKGALGEAYQALVGVVKDYYTLGTYDNGVQKLIGMGISEPGLNQLKATKFGALDSAKTELTGTLARNASQLEKTGYSNTIEGQGIIQSAKAVQEVADLEKRSNIDLLNSVPQTTTSTASLDNNSFFNR